MTNKKKVLKHLMLIYVFYFVVIIYSFFSSLASFRAGYAEARDEQRQYTLASEIISTPDNLKIEGMPEDWKLSIDQITLNKEIDHNATVKSEISGQHWLVLLLNLWGAVAFLAVFVLIAVIINSLRKAVRHEHPLMKREITLTRVIGGLVIFGELCFAYAQYLTSREVAVLLADTGLKVQTAFTLNDINIILGVVFLYMAEVFTIGSELSEEQEYTI